MDSETSQPLASFMVPGSSFGYTAAPVTSLLSFKNTLAIGLLDESGSTAPFARQMELFCKELIKALRHSDESDTIIYRQCHFATDFREHHGFTPLSQLNEDQYDGCYSPGGQTTLYDSCDRVLTELADYARQQAKSKYLCNGFVFIITDGRDYGSSLKEHHVKERLEKVIGEEALESLFTVLVGVNDNADIQRDLEQFQQNVGFTKYIPLKDASEKSLAKLFGWVSQQIRSQSQSLGTGGPSQSLTF